MTFTPELDARFGETDAPADWAAVGAALTSAELYWLTTVREDGRPHVTPLVGLWVDDSFVFCTGPEEQKARNLAHGRAVAVTTGTNTWKAGLDVVVEGDAERITGLEATTALADAYREKYRGEWDFTPGADGFEPDGHLAHVFRVMPTKVLAFAKAPHGQTRFRP
ncbi:MAG: pyridoxamine 5'-phosphate oxidase family protein [Mycobacterium sp.]